MGEQLSNAPPSPSEPPSTPATSISSTTESQQVPDVVVAGALAVDFSCDYAPFTASTSQTDPLPHTSNPAVITQTLGGVAHNIVKASHLLGSFVHLHSAVGDDLSGRAALSQLQSEGMPTTGIKTLPAPSRTAQYVAINNTNKDLALAMADMSILETIPVETIQELATSIFTTTSPRPRVFVTDANWSSPALHAWLQAARHPDTTTIFEPVSTAKALRIFPSTSSATATAAQSIYPTPLADIITPNTYELTALHDFAAQSSLFESPEWFGVIDALGIPNGGLRVPLAVTVGSELVDQGIPQQTIKLLPFFPTILTKLGSKGVLMTKLLTTDADELHDEKERAYVLARNLSSMDSAGKDGKGKGKGVGGLYIRLFPVEKVLQPSEVVSVNGIGDTFCGAVAHGLGRGREVKDVVGFAQRAAGESLRSREAVGEGLKALTL